jgi:flagellar biosynthesis component FlhA
MDTQRMCLSAKTASEYLSTTAGAVLIIIDVVGMFFGIPPIATFLVVGLIGLAAGVWGAFSAWREDVKREKKEQAAEQERIKREQAAEQERINREQAVAQERKNMTEEHHVLLQLVHEMHGELGKMQRYVTAENRHRVQKTCKKYTAKLRRSTTFMYKSLDIKSLANNNTQEVVVESKTDSVPSAKSANDAFFNQKKSHSSNVVKMPENTNVAGLRLSSNFG